MADHIIHPHYLHHPKPHKNELLKIWKKNLKGTPEEKAGTIPGSTISTAVAWSLRQPQLMFWDEKHTGYGKVRN